MSLINSDLKPFKTEAYKAVSYTHLDVYKRQSLDYIQQNWVVITSATKQSSDGRIPGLRRKARNYARLARIEL